MLSFITLLPGLVCLFIHTAVVQPAASKAEAMLVLRKKEDIKPESVIRRQDFGLPIEQKKLSKAELLSAKLQRALAE